MIIQHDRYCPSCDRELDCGSYIQNLGVIIVGPEVWCPACYLNTRDLRYPGDNLICAQCQDIENAALINAVLGIRTRWQTYFRRAGIAGIWHLDGGTFNVSCGGETLAMLVSPTWDRRRPAEAPLAPGEIPCECNNCARRHW